MIQWSRRPFEPWAGARAAAERAAVPRPGPRLAALALQRRGSAGSASGRMQAASPRHTAALPSSSSRWVRRLQKSVCAVASQTQAVCLVARALDGQRNRGRGSTTDHSKLRRIAHKVQCRFPFIEDRSGMRRHLPNGIMCATPRTSVRLHWRAVHVVSSGPVRQFKKCRFQAHVADVAMEEDIKDVMAAVVASDKKVAKATHSAIAAWRLEPASSSPSSEPLAGYDDCGESGAGKRLLQLLQARGDTNTLVAVTRWYGGKPLGGARFRQITNAANELLTERSKNRAR